MVWASTFAQTAAGKSERQGPGPAGSIVGAIAIAGARGAPPGSHDIALAWGLACTHRLRGSATCNNRTGVASMSRRCRRQLAQTAPAQRLAFRC